MATSNDETLTPYTKRNNWKDVIMFNNNKNVDKVNLSYVSREGITGLCSIYYYESWSYNYGKLEGYDEKLCHGMLI